MARVYKPTGRELQLENRYVSGLMGMILLWGEWRGKGRRVKQPHVTYDDPYI